MKTSILGPAILLACCAFATAQEKDPSADKDDKTAKAAGTTIRAQLEYVELPHETLTKLLREGNGKPIDDAALRIRAHELADKKEAKLLETIVVTARDKVHAEGGSASEFTYPTEYEPPDWPVYPSGKTVPSPMGASVFAPTAYETRNVGSSFEIDPFLAADGRTINFQFKSEMVWNTSQKVWAEAKDALGNVSKSEMPRFYSLTLKSEVVCTSGGYLLVGTFSPKDQAGEMDPDRKLMVFLKCDIVAPK